MKRRWFPLVAGLLFLPQGSLFAFSEVTKAAPVAGRLAERHGLTVSAEGEAQVLRGRLGSLMSFLHDLADAHPAQPLGRVELRRKPEEFAAWSLTLGPEAQSAPSPIGLGFLAFASILETPAEDLRLTALSFQGRSVTLAGEGLSFEAINLFRTRLMDPRTARLLSMEYPKAARQGAVIGFTIQGALRSDEPWPGGWGVTRLEELVACLDRQLPLNALSHQPLSLHQVAFRGWAKSAGRVFAIAAAADGNTRMLPVGYHFSEGEILAVDSEGVKIRQGAPDSTEGAIIRVPFRKAQQP